MNNKLKIVPTVLEQSIEEAERQLKEIVQYTDMAQVDILDGLFEDNLTISVGDLQSISIPEDLKLDMHLMIEYPIDVLGDCHTIGAYRVLGQIEKMHSQADFISQAEELNLKPGLAVDLYTPIESLDTSLFPRLDGILLMSVKAGWSGQSFNPTVLEKIKQLRSLGFSQHIVMDGGMNAETICLCARAGADQFGANNYFWKAEDKQAVLTVECG